MRRRSRALSIRGLILIPALVTFGVTLLRLIGELFGWSELWFSTAAGGGSSPVGIAWLAPFFGAYFALELAKNSLWPASLSGLLARSLVSLGIFGGGLVLMRVLEASYLVQVVGTGLISVAAILFARLAWPALHTVLLSYAFAARIPVALIMLLAILGNWGTHYDASPTAGFPAMSLAAKWILIGLAPQMTAWLAYTVLTGSLCGGLALAIRRRALPAERFLPSRPEGATAMETPVMASLSSAPSVEVTKTTRRTVTDG